MRSNRFTNFEYCEELLEWPHRSELSKVIARVYAKPYREFGENGNYGELRISIETVIAELQRLNPDKFRKIAACMALVFTYAAVVSNRFDFPEDEPKFLQVILALEAFLRNEKPTIPKPDAVFPDIAQKGKYSPAILTFHIAYCALQIPTSNTPDKVLLWILDSALIDEGLNVVPQVRRRYFNWWLSEVIPSAKKGKFPKHILAIGGFVEFETWRKQVLGKK